VKTIAKRPPSIESLILTVREKKVLIDSDLARIYEVETRALNQAVKRNAERFPEDFIFQLTAKEKAEVITKCDHLARLKFSKALPFAFTEHGSLMAASVLNSPRAVAMSVYVVRAFLQMREQLAVNREILKRLADIDKTLLQHDSVLQDIYRKLLPLLKPHSDPPKRQIGFGKGSKK
jgi:ORF6N domain-containing protein